MDKGQKISAQNGQDPHCIFSRLGGDGAISDMIDQFYYKVLFDKSLRGFFYKADMSRVRLQQKIYFGCIFGAKGIDYEGRNLIELHRNMGVTHKNYDTCIYHFRNILKDMDLEDELIDKVIARIEEQRKNVVFEKQGLVEKI